MEKENKKGNFWIGFFLGGLFGAVLIFIWGTKEGKKIAKKLLEKGELLEEDIAKKIDDLQEKSEDIMDQAKEVKEKITKNVEVGKKTVSKELITKMENALDKLEDVQKKGVSFTQDLKKNYFRKDGKSLGSKH